MLNKYLIINQAGTMIVRHAVKAEDAVKSFIDDHNCTEEDIFEVHDISLPEGKFKLAPREVIRHYELEKEAEPEQNSTKMPIDPPLSPPAFKGERASDRAATAALDGDGTPFPTKVCCNKIISAPTKDDPLKGRHCNRDEGHPGACDPDDIPF